MSEFQHFSKILICLGLLTTFIGVLLYFSGKLPWVGKLPGDILIKKENFSLFFPIGTCILISLLLTVVLNLFFRK